VRSTQVGLVGQRVLDVLQGAQPDPLDPPEAGRGAGGLNRSGHTSPPGATFLTAELGVSEQSPHQMGGTQ
jgi:hypothetical protein